MNDIPQFNTPSSSRSPTTPLREIDILSGFLEGIRLEVHAGECVSIMGESGSGKSTLVRTLLGLSGAEEAHVRLFGAPPLHHENRGRLGVAFQQPGLFDGRSVMENLGISGTTEQHNDLVHILEFVGLSSIPPDQLTGVLSGGQQKRLAIVRALLHGRKLIVLDEPTSGLDAESVVQVARLLRHHCLSTGTSLLCITHDKNFAASVSTRIMNLGEGRLVDATESTRNSADKALVERMTAPPPEDLRIPVGIDPATSDSLAGTDSWSPEMIFRRNLPSALAITTIPMVLLGMLMVAQTAQASPIDISSHVPALVVAVVFRELAPLVVGLLLAARIGANLSSEIAGMSYTAQLDTMKVMGHRPERLTMLHPALALMVLFPLAILTSAFLAVFQGVYTSGIPWFGLTIGGTRFASLAFEAITPSLVLGCVLKGVAMGALVAVVSYRQGARHTRSARELGSNVTRANMLNAIGIVCVNIVLSLVLYMS